MKILFRNIHLYLSLASGLIIAIVCFTGGVLVFEKELDQAWHPERFFVTPPARQPRLPLAQLLDGVKATDPKAKIGGVKVYADPARTVEISLAGGPGGPGGKPEGGREGKAEGGKARAEQGSGAEHGPRGEKGKGEKGKGGGGEGGRGPVLYVNPYTGAIIDKVNYRDTFFFTMMALHRGMVGGPVGKLVVGVSTLLFLFIIATGIVLWWPATRNIVKQRLTIKWDASFKRLNHDLHIVLGFYSALFLFVFAFTGLAWSFEWFNNGIFAVTNSDPKGPEAPKSTLVLNGGKLTFDQAYTVARQQVPGALSYAISLPKDSTEAVRVNTTSANAAYEGATDELYLDQYSGQPLGKLNFADRNLGQRVRRTFKPVHTGAIFGTPSKIVAVVVCLLGVTFPVTGVIMWLNRLRKAKKKQQKQAAVAA
ncbi:PepSY-associated TM helix domain-containing protein [Hymenobacter chitinivorans]|uniref:Putative iron-regulated membrane protein n=1 Tax=Hymenobacter chitinivorans DSM 11115 TaxID=1121954 RepID=A0A2M9BSE6_9BACT|nr:PepSY-associated TM helix domain-containing protein [Hymenobacter chitinivorans]PJJ60868.1 putative iron-regulated membrane protein [Hymenobacter chitinivorans DSM 11115]